MRDTKFRWILEEIVFIISLAIPASVECFTEGLQMKLSNIFIGKYANGDFSLMLSALFIGQTVISLVSYPIAEGSAIYVIILCSQAYGAKQYKLVGLYLHRALIWSVLTCIPVFTMYIGLRPLVYLLFRDHDLAELSGSYADILCFGYPAYLYYKIGIRFLQALNIVWAPALYLLIGTTVNGILQYVLIFQYNCSLQGAAAGYVISNYLIALLVFAHIQLSHIHRTISHEWSIELISDWYHTGKYAISTILQTLVSSAPLIVLPILAIGVFTNNQRQLAIYSVLFSVGWLFSLVAMGFSSAITVRVGNLLGANEPTRAKKVAVLCIALGQILLILLNILLLSVSEPLSHLFTTDADFAKDLTWNIRIFSIVLNTNTNFIVQGVMNACCKQGIQTVIKVVFQVVFGTVATFLLVYLVEWEALSILIQFSVDSAVCMVIALFILFCSDWNKITLVVNKNTRMSTRSDGMLQESIRNPSLTKLICESKVFIISRYFVILVVSTAFFSCMLLLRMYMPFDAY